MQPITGIGKRQELGRSRFATPEHNILPFIIPCSGSGESPRCRCASAFSAWRVLGGAFPRGVIRSAVFVCSLPDSGAQASFRELARECGAHCASTMMLDAGGFANSAAFRAQHDLSHDSGPLVVPRRGPEFGGRTDLGKRSLLFSKQKQTKQKRGMLYVLCVCMLAV